MKYFLFILFAISPFVSNSQELEIDGVIKISENNDANPQAGTIRWNAAKEDFEGFNGSAWISLTKANSWAKTKVTEHNKILASDASGGDHFGVSVAISGDYAIVGARNNGLGGAAYILHRNGEIWTEQTKLTASDAGADDQFGYSVDISGNHAIVGARLDDDWGASSGSAYIFIRIGTSWTEQDKIIASDADAGDQFGFTVAIDGNYAIVGATANNDNGNNSGSAYIFEKSGSSWPEQEKLLASDAAEGDLFGRSVSISGDYAIVGSPEAGTEGKAYVFVRSGSTWTEQEILTASDQSSGDDFGRSVDILDNNCVVGATRKSGDYTFEGAAYIFERSGTNWSEVAKVSPSNPNDGLNFGYSVSLSDDYLVVGSLDEDPQFGIGNGQVYVFNLTESTVVEQAQLCQSDGASHDFYGISVSISGDYIIVGAEAGAGAAYIFK